MSFESSSCIRYVKQFYTLFIWWIIPCKSREFEDWRKRFWNNIYKLIYNIRVKQFFIEVVPCLFFFLLYSSNIQVHVSDIRFNFFFIHAIFSLVIGMYKLVSSFRKRDDRRNSVFVKDTVHLINSNTSKNILKDYYC